MSHSIPYPVPSGPMRKILPYMQDGFLSPTGADLLLKQGVPWSVVARHVQDIDWWGKQQIDVSPPPELPWSIQSWGATLCLRTHNTEIWVDPGPKSPIPSTAPNLIIVTHAHYDHVAQLAAFSGAFPRVRVVMSEETYFLLSLRVQHDTELKACLERRSTQLELEKRREIEGLRLTLLPAGHLLGAVMVEIGVGEDVILITGDFALRDVGGLTGAPWLERGYSIMLMESTSIHQGMLPVADVQANRMPFLKRVDDALRASRTRVLVSAQSMGQAQELYAALVLAQQAGAFPDFKVRLAGFVETVSRKYYDVLRETSRVWSCPFYTLQSNEVPEQSLVIIPEEDEGRSPLAREVEASSDGEYIESPLVFTHAGWAERMAWAVGVRSYAVGLYDGYSSSIDVALSNIGRRVKALSQEGEEWLTNEMM